MNRNMVRHEGFEPSRGLYKNPQLNQSVMAQNPFLFKNG